MLTKNIWIKILIVVVVALVLGIVGLSLVFSDLSNSETSVMRFTLTAAFFFFCGFSVGYFYIEKWWLSILTALWSTLFGSSLVILSILKKGKNVFNISGPPYISAGLMILFLPLGLALLGGYLGSLAFRKRQTCQLG